MAKLNCLSILRLSHYFINILPINSNTFWGPPFFKKGPLKLENGGHWPISRINPENFLSLVSTHKHAPR